MQSLVGLLDSLFGKRETIKIPGLGNAILVVVVLLLALLIPFAGCQKSPEDARRELGTMGVQYTEEAFVKAAQNGDVLAIKLFLAAGMDPNTMDNDRTPILIWAASKGPPAAIQALLDKGAGVDWKDPEGRTALMLAAGTRHLDEVGILLDNGADVNAKDKQGRTPFWYALHCGVLETSVDIVKIFLDKVPKEVNVRSEEGSEALSRAVILGYTDVTKALIARGADVNVRGSGDSTHLMAAASLNHADVVKILLANGASVNVRNYKGQTALSMANEKGYAEVAQLLKKAGATE